MSDVLEATAESSEYDDLYAKAGVKAHADGCGCTQTPAGELHHSLNDLEGEWDTLETLVDEFFAGEHGTGDAYRIGLQVRELRERIQALVGMALDAMNEDLRLRERLNEESSHA